jgi:hypothetical protein
MQQAAAELCLFCLQDWMRWQGKSELSGESQKVQPQQLTQTQQMGHMRQQLFAIFACQ